MENKVLHTSRFLISELVTEGNYFLNTWSGYTSKEEYLEAIELIIFLMSSYGVSNIIADLREHNPASFDAQIKSKQKVVNYANKAGQVKIAFITRSKAINNTDKIQVNQSGLVLTAFFNDMDQAVKWIKMDGDLLYQKAL